MQNSFDPMCWAESSSKFEFGWLVRALSHGIGSKQNDQKNRIQCSPMSSSDSEQNMRRILKFNNEPIHFYCLLMIMFFMINPLAHTHKHRRGIFDVNVFVLYWHHFNWDSTTESHTHSMPNTKGQNFINRRCRRRRRLRRRRLHHHQDIKTIINSNETTTGTGFAVNLIALTKISSCFRIWSTTDFKVCVRVCRRVRHRPRRFFNFGQ